MKSDKKLAQLKKIIASYGSCLVAFSGGADSTLLLKVAGQALPGDKLLAVTAVSALRPKKEGISALKTAQALGVRHKFIKSAELKNKKFSSNPRKRCYFCKQMLFQKLSLLARQYNLKFILEASNISDKSDFRPGNQAKKEFKIKSPLIEAGLSKSDVRRLSKKLGLSTWNKPAISCLATRVPYGIEINPELLKKIGLAEDFLNSLGLKDVRLRHYNGLCRIEVASESIGRLIKKRKRIVQRLKRLGYVHISLDLEGFRSGSMNLISKKDAGKNH